MKFYKVYFSDGTNLTTYDEEAIDRVLFGKDRFVEINGVAYNIAHIIKIECRRN